MSNIYRYKVKDCIPKHIFECGQCFRWKPAGYGKYTGIGYDHPAAVCMDGPNTLVVESFDHNDLYDFWHDYFDLSRDYSKIKSIIAKDDIMKTATRFGRGIRLLKQDFNELTVSFIISANNRIPRIMKSIEVLSSLYGECTGEYYGNEEIKFFTFPTIEKLASLSADEINLCKCGFRSDYIKKTSSALNEGILDVCKACPVLTDSSFCVPLCKKALLSLSGIGPKVADCILLFSGNDYSSFPIDVWVKRVMEKMYLKRESSFKEIADFAKNYWGEYAGFAQQYLFYFARENNI